jgi:nitrite reductase/ring-hydroxylating ferredoxin subunit
LSKLNERPGKPEERQSDAGASVVAGSIRVVCASAELAERGDGVRFEIEWEGESTPAFVIRHDGRVCGYLNRCSHIGVELDWTQGKFFDAGGEYLICSTHGALYAPESGACRGGPCRGAKLAALDVFEDGGKVYIKTKG